MTSSSGSAELFGDVNVRVLAVIALVTSAIHFADNALRLDVYPGPSWFTPAGVAASWLCVPALAWLAFRMQSVFLLLLFSVSGLFGLEHYLLSPPCSVPWRVNVTVIAEASASAILALFVVQRAVLADMPGP